jgi:putative ABC transport system ATP-binding protein
VISARGIKKVYRDESGQELTVLDGLSLEVATGDFVAVVGPSGCGKSTLLHVLGGLDVHYGGEVEIDRARLTGMSDRALAAFRNRHIGFVFQAFHLVPALSAIENVLLPSFFASRERAPEPGGPRQRAEEVLERVGLAGKRDRLPGRLSGGERQRVAIARALFGRPRVLLCDEPTGNLDARTGEEIIGLFKGLNAEGMTVLAVTHEERMSAAARSVLRLKDGRLHPEEGASMGGGA